ncbi:hypothetical protein LTR84_008241 [Exophiala bonariae]|uniref:Uncharacterized protein n=1 Tax=Exophiala bonariae TaxID=1690606 RepID=A0AAV9N1B0_9EURO|nr:hypothetical protein LTR84_008241 [Exophiala bonariae]
MVFRSGIWQSRTRIRSSNCKELLQQGRGKLQSGLKGHQRKTNVKRILHRVHRQDLIDDAGRGWRSPWLRQASLIAITGILGSIILGLALLFYFSKSTEGLPLKIKNHFAWTYGPTAILTIVVAYWRQIDTASKALTPWDELRRGNAEPSKSILLDYMSPLQAISLYEAIRAKHGAIVVTITGFVILKLLTLASTGLLFSTPTALSSVNRNIIRNTQLDGALYEPTSFPGLFDPSMAYTAYAVMANGLRHPEGTTTELVYEQIQPLLRNRVENTTLKTRVNALIPMFSCESAPVDIYLQPANVTDVHPEDTIKLLFPECTLRNDGKGTSVYALNPRNLVCPKRQLSPLLQQIDCIDQTASDADQHWQLLTLADYRYQQSFANTTGLSLGDSNVVASSSSRQVEKVIGVACRSDFLMEEVEVIYDYSQDPPFILVIRVPQSRSIKLDNFTGADLGLLTTSALTAGAGMFGNFVDNQAVLEYPNTLFKMMAQTSNGSYETLLDEGVMINAAEKVLNQVAIQSVSKYLVRAAISTISGTVSEVEERLQVNEAAFIVMLCASGLLVVLTFTLFFICPQRACSNDPMPISNTALVLSLSNEMKPLLDKNMHVGGETRADLHDRMKDCTFSLVPRKSHDQILVSFQPTITSSIQDTTPKSSPVETQQWWTPLTLQRWVLAPALGLPLAALIVLEVLQQLCDRYTGIATLPAQASDVSIIIYTRFLPALFMLLVATLINALDFNVLLLAPFNALRAESDVPPAQSVLVSFLGLPVPVTIWKSLRLRHCGVLLSTIAALIASILTIIVSGLFTIENIASSQAVFLVRMDQFNSTWINSAKNDSSAAVLSSLTESLGLDYPAFTFAEYAFPTLRTSIGTDGPNASDPKVRIQLPALRSDLGCVQLSKEMMNVSATFNTRINAASASVFARVPLPPECQLGGSDGNLTELEFDNSFSMRGNTSFVGKILDLHVGPFDSISASSSGELSPNTQRDNPPDCPSLAFIFGYANVDVPAETTITALMCYQYIDELEANVTMTWPSLTILPSQPPVPDEITRRRLPSGPNGETAFQFRLQVHMDDEFSSFNQSTDNTTTTSGSAPPLDNFFQGAIFGKSALDPALLRSKDDKAVGQVYDAIRGLYRRYMAQAISANMRVPATATATATATGPTTKQPTLTGTLERAHVSRRVMQNRTAKLILQCQLGAIFVLSSLAMYLTQLRNILPYNPCCIAGVAALFAQSRMCDLDDWVGRRVLEDGGKGFRDGCWTFRLGWWDLNGPVSEGGPGRWYGVDALEVGGGASAEEAPVEPVGVDERYPAWV